MPTHSIEWLGRVNEIGGEQAGNSLDVKRIQWPIFTDHRLWPFPNPGKISECTLHCAGCLLLFVCLFICRQPPLNPIGCRWIGGLVGRMVWSVGQWFECAMTNRPCYRWKRSYKMAIQIADLINNDMLISRAHCPMVVNIVGEWNGLYIFSLPEWKSHLLNASRRVLWPKVRTWTILFPGVKITHPLSTCLYCWINTPEIYRCGDYSYMWA